MLADLALDYIGVGVEQVIEADLRMFDAHSLVASALDLGFRFALALCHGRKLGAHVIAVNRNRCDG